MKKAQQTNGAATNGHAESKRTDEPRDTDRASLLDRVIAATPTADEWEAEQLSIALRELCAKAGDGAALCGSTMSRLDDLVLECETMISEQLSEIIEHPAFRALESKWLGLKRLVEHVPLGEEVKLKLWNASREDVLADLDASQNDMLRTRIFDVLCREPVDTLGGVPISLAIFGWDFDPGPESMRALNHVTDVLEAASVPGVGDASPTFFGTDDFSKLMRHPDDLKTLFAEDDRLAAYRTYRTSTKSVFFGLTVPRYLARLPYDAETQSAPGVEFFEEQANGTDSRKFVWGSLAMVFGELTGIALSETGWTARVTGWLGGGRVDDLPLYTYDNDAGQTVTRPPTETVVDGLLEPALAQLGFIGMQWKAGTTSGVFDAAQSTNKPKETTDDAANAAAVILSRLPLLSATCRVGAHMKVMLKELIGSMMGPADIKSFLETWIKDIIVVNETASLDIKAKYPLQSAVIDVVPSNAPGGYDVRLTVRHWVGIDSLSVAISVAAPAPTPADSQATP
jgi:type VI secretion system protein ImpC